MDERLEAWHGHVDERLEAAHGQGPFCVVGTARDPRVEGEGVAEVLNMMVTL